MNRFIAVAAGLIVIAAWFVVFVAACLLPALIVQLAWNHFNVLGHPIELWESWLALTACGVLVRMVRG